MKRCSNITAWTDYPMVEFGDAPGKEAPIRHVKVIAYDMNKYVTIQIIGTDVITWIKAGYLYRKETRYGKSKSLNLRKINRMKQ